MVASHKKILITNSQSALKQESFVYSVTQGKRGGSFVEIGSHDPIGINNTFLLERSIGWRGLAFEISWYWVLRYRLKRNSQCVWGDATRVDYQKYFSKFNMPHVIDYLQIDIEPALNSLQALRAIPFNDYEFRCITFEHDYYAHPNNEYVRLSSREILASLGYELVCADVSSDGGSVEDWWVHPHHVDKTTVDLFRCSNEDHNAIFRGSDEMVLTI